MAKTIEKRVALMLAAGILILFLAGCSSPSQNLPAGNAQNITNAPPASPGCGNEACFITAANNCESMNLTVTDEVGTFSFSSSKSCVFTKTLVSLNANETREMKNALEGKSMYCIYEKGNFDQRWVTSLIYGLENCQGDLKDRLADLTIFP
ncbi:MAG: hypothetical protein NT157_05600 [Candidatus Micrarchaeota archaeon]|nr:hypothetical protein [Candidatus Micrarchaeota archaeon]